MHRLSHPLYAIAVCIALTATAHATTYAVGSGSGCTHATLRAALTAAAANSSGPHTIKLAVTEDLSLSNSLGGELVLNNFPADISIEGGYASCTAASATGSTVLAYNDPTTDWKHRLLLLKNNAGNPRRTLTLKNLIITGNVDATGAGHEHYGGAVYMQGPLTVHLVDVLLSGFRADYGGAVAVGREFGSPPDPDEYPVLKLTRSIVTHNHATANGGAVYLEYGQLVLEGARFEHNAAMSNGGAIAAWDVAEIPNHDAILIKSAPSSTVFWNNYAGLFYSNGDPKPFTESEGFGGAIYSHHADIAIERHTHAQAAGLKPTAVFSQNYANQGGAIYAEGPYGPNGTPYTAVWLWDTGFGENMARGNGGAVYSMDGVDWRFNSSAADLPLTDSPLPRIGPRMVFVGNRAQAMGSGTGGGVAYVTDQDSGGTTRGILRVERTWFLDNSSDGASAVATTDANGDMYFRRSIFENNASNAIAGGAMLYLGNNRDIELTYSTVLDNQVEQLFMVHASPGPRINVTGSILWSASTSSNINSTAAFGTELVAIDQCVITDLYDHFGGSGPSSWNRDPQLDIRYAPRGSSPALDHCDASDFSPIYDVNWRSAYDVKGITSRSHTGPSHWDVGAVEQTDIIFANSFGHRPGN